jgi:hypothetical protein
MLSHRNVNILNGALCRQFRGIRMLNANRLYHLVFGMASDLCIIGQFYIINKKNIIVMELYCTIQNVLKLIWFYGIDQ